MSVNPFKTKPPINEHQRKLLEEISHKYAELWDSLKRLSESRYRSLAVTQLEISHGLIEKHVERHELTHNINWRANNAENSCENKN